MVILVKLLSFVRPPNQYTDEDIQENNQGKNIVQKVKLVPSFLVFTAIIAIFSVFVPSNTFAMGKKPELMDLRKDVFVVAIPTYPGFAIPFIAEKKGFFSNQKVVLKRIDDPAIINSGIIKGEIDGTFTSTDSFVLAAAQGVDAQAVLLADESYGADGIVVKKNIKNIGELKGKKIALNIGWPGHFFLLYNLDKVGLTPGDVTIINMDADKAGAAFVSGKLDAAVTWEPWLSKAREYTDGKVLVSTKDIRGIIIDPLIVSSATILKYPGSVQAFVDGYYKAFKWYMENKTEGNSIMANAFGLAQEEFEAMISSSFLLGPAESKKMLQRGGDIEKLFTMSAALWTASKVIDKKPETITLPVNAEFIR